MGTKYVQKSHFLRNFCKFSKSDLASKNCMLCNKNCMLWKHFHTLPKSDPPYFAAQKKRPQMFLYRKLNSKRGFIHHQRKRFYFPLFSARVRINLLPWWKNAFLHMVGRKLITNITNCHYLPQRHTNTVCKIKCFTIRPAFTFNNWLGLRWGSNKQ